MPLCKHWATIEDFATLFQYFWHRDFPIDPERSTGAHRIDWTTHTGMIVRSIADHFGFTARFEQKGRIDGILRSGVKTEIAVEWEWDEIARWIKKEKGNELTKLKEQNKSRKKKSEWARQYSALITYTLTPDEEINQAVYSKVQEKWQGADWPLLLVLITATKSRTLSSGREFLDMRTVKFKDNKCEEIRKIHACPWALDGTRWFMPEKK